MPVNPTECRFGVVGCDNSCHGDHNVERMLHAVHLESAVNWAREVSAFGGAFSGAKSLEILLAELADLRSRLANAERRATEWQRSAEYLADDAPPQLIPLEQWHEDDGDVLWWRVPISEPPYVGSLAEVTNGWHTHFTRIIVPVFPLSTKPGTLATPESK